MNFGSHNKNRTRSSEKLIVIGDSNVHAFKYITENHLIIESANLGSVGKQNSNTGSRTQIENFIPSQYKIKNDVLVYQNILGGVNAFVNDEIHELTNLVDSQFEIFGNRVLVKMFNNSFIVLENGKQYTN